MILRVAMSLYSVYCVALLGVPLTVNAQSLDTPTPDAVQQIDRIAQIRPAPRHERVAATTFLYGSALACRCRDVRAAHQEFEGLLHDPAERTALDGCNSWKNRMIQVCTRLGQSMGVSSQSFCNQAVSEEFAINSCSNVAECPVG